MSKATLTLDGMAPLQGTAEAGGDYIRFQTDGAIGADAPDRLHKGRIEMNGKTEKVMLKSVRTDVGDGKAELTLQRFQPSPV